MKKGIISQIRFLVLSIIIMNFIVLIAFPLVFSHFAYPGIIELVKGRNEQRAIQISNYFIQDSTFSSFKEERARNAVKSFNLLKVKEFDSSGTIVFSTDSSEIGLVNSKPYFRDIVAQGEVYSLYVNKNDTTHNGEEYNVHLIETYVPIVEGSEFKGAFEIYHIVNKELRGSLNVLHGARNIFLALGAFMLTFLVVFGIRFVNLETEVVLGATEIDSLQSGDTSYYSPVRSLIIILSSIFCSEIIVMVMVSQLELPIAVSAILDGAVLTIILAPVLYFGVFKSLLNSVVTLAERDISLNDAKHSAERANNAKTRFLANMTHELRTPMNAVIGMSHILERTPLNNEQTDCVETILSSGEVLLSVVNNVLDISKMESGKLILEETEFDIRAMADDTLHILSVLAHEKGININLIIDHRISSHVIGDSMRLKQIIINLGNNAIKFTREGSVEIRLFMVNRDDDTESIRFTISDTGVGIPTNLREHIFNPFTQADESTARQFGGTGLGLTISSQFVSLMGGSITIEDDHRWSTVLSFTITLPIAQGKQNQQITSPLKDKRVFLVTDNHDEPNSIEEMLKYLEMDISTFQISIQTLETVILKMNKSEAPDILIFENDASCDGCICHRNLKSEISWGDSVPSVVIPGNCDRGGASECEKHGYDGYIAKPIRQSELNKTLQLLIDDSEMNIHEHHPIVTRYTLKDEEKKQLKIAIVDDNPVNLRVAIRALEKVGFSPKSYNSGEDIIEAVSMERPDVIFMDIHMPLLDGFQTTAIIREIEKKRDWISIPIFALTAAVIDMESEDADASLFNGIVSKPFNLGDLQEKIENLFTE